VLLAIVGIFALVYFDPFNLNLFGRKGATPQAISATENDALWAKANTALAGFLGEGMKTFGQADAQPATAQELAPLSGYINDFNQAVKAIANVTPPPEQSIMHRALLPVYQEMPGPMKGVRTALLAGDSWAADLEWQKLALLLDEVNGTKEILSPKPSTMAVTTVAVTTPAVTTPAAVDFYSGLVAQWDFSGNANDSSSNGNNGTVYGGATYVPSPIGQALNCDGVDDYVNMGNSGTLKPTTNITIAMWIKPGATQNKYADILGGHQNSQGYVVQRNSDNPNNPDNLYYFAYYNGSTWQGGAITTLLTAGVWQLFVVQKEGNTIRHYVNGVKTAEGSVSGDIYYHPEEPFYVGIGYSPGSGRNFNGFIDKVMIWKTVVPAAELELSLK